VSRGHCFAGSAALSLNRLSGIGEARLDVFQLQVGERFEHVFDLGVVSEMLKHSLHRHTSPSNDCFAHHHIRISSDALK